MSPRHVICTCDIFSCLVLRAARFKLLIFHFLNGNDCIIFSLNEFKLATGMNIKKLAYISYAICFQFASCTKKRKQSRKNQISFLLFQMTRLILITVLWGMSLSRHPVLIDCLRNL